ncbi:MAG: dihydrodipicolinate synthase family protein [Pirellula sp.]
MKQTDYSQRIQSSVIAVPPLARTSDYAVCEQENRRLIEHLKSGGIRTFLYGGNALFYHIRLSEYAQVVHQVVELAGPDSWVIPSIGSSFGMMMDQAAIAADLPVDTVMVLPQKDITDVGGIERGLRLAVDRMGKPVVLYLKFDRWLPPDAVERLVKAGCVSWIKYAVVLPDPDKDPYLRELLERIPSELFVSGMGEQPAICHMRDFRMGGFTSGCVCVRPDLSTLMLQAIQAGDWQKAEAIREIFEPLEDQRNSISPIRVLHDAVRTSGISDVGPLLPLMSGLDEAQLGGLVRVVETLRGASLR